MTGWHDYFVSHAELRPAVTLDAQLAFVKANSKNVHLAQSVVAVPLSDLAKTASFGTNFVQLGVTERLDIASSVVGLRAIGAERLKLETLAAPGLVLDAALNQAVTLPTESLALPAVQGVQVPAVGAVIGTGVGNTVKELRLPANPRELIDVRPVLPVEPPVDVPDLPLLPF